MAILKLSPLFGGVGVDPFLSHHIFFLRLTSLHGYWIYLDDCICELMLSLFYDHVRQYLISHDFHARC